jgi:hypothetical protein
MKKHLISALRSERRRNYTMNASIVSAVFMIMIWTGLLTGFIMIGIKRCLHFLSPLQMPFVFLIGGLMVLGALGVSSPGAVGAFQRTIRDNHNGMTNCADLLRDNALKGGEKKAHCDSMIMESIRLIDELTGKDK